MMVEEQRAAPRVSVQVPTEYENSHTGSGVTENVSVSGVLIDHASRSMAIQTAIRLRFSFFIGSFDTVFHGTVIRQTGDGFAVQFGDMDQVQLEVLRRILRLSPLGLP